MWLNQIKGGQSVSNIFIIQPLEQHEWQIKSTVATGLYQDKQQLMSNTGPKPTPNPTPNPNPKWTEKLTLMLPPILTLTLNHDSPKNAWAHCPTWSDCKKSP